MSATIFQLRDTLLGLAMLAIALPAVGCDQARHNPSASHVQASSFQAQTLRALLSPAGIEHLLEDEYRLGIPLHRGAQPAAEFGLDLSIGPLAQPFEIAHWQVESSVDQLDISAMADAFMLTIPLRVRDASLGEHATRICRFTAAADQAQVHVQATLRPETADTGALVPLLSSLAAPQVALSAARVEPLGSCPPVDALAGPEVDMIHLHLLTYLEQAIAESFASAIELSPVRSLGFLHAPAALERVSNFPNRRGELWVNGRTHAAGTAGAQLTMDGLRMDLDVALNSKRAPCAPALVAQAPGAAPAGPVSQSDLAGAHAAIALATPLLSRMAQASVSAGFACRGLEDSAIEFDSSRRAIQRATQELNLEAVGLAELDLGHQTSALLIAGALPTISTDPANAALKLHWEALGLELYAEIQGVRVRILELRADLTMSLHLRSEGWAITQNQVRFSLNALELSGLTIQSQWTHQDLSNANADPKLRQWAQRAWLLILQDFFHFPLPLLPNSSLRLDSAQVRSDDLLLRFKFDPAF